MGYYSTLEGQITMGIDSYRKMMEEKIKYGDRELSLLDCLREINYDGSCVSIFSEGKHYYVNEIMSLLAKYKEGEDIDMIDYQGDDWGDIGIYYLGVGRWCFVQLAVQPPPDDPKDWMYVR